MNGNAYTYYYFKILNFFKPYAYRITKNKKRRIGMCIDSVENVSCTHPFNIDRLVIYRIKVDCYLQSSKDSIILVAPIRGYLILQYEKTIYLLCQIRPTMSNFSEDDIRHAAEVREWIMKQISDKQEQVDRMSTILALIDNLLKQSSFKPASSIPSSSSLPSSVGLTSQISQKSTTDPQMVSGYSRNQRIGITGNGSPSALTETTAAESQKQLREDSSEEGEVQHKPLKRLKDDFLIANAEISQNSVEIIPAKGIALNINTPPFKSFFLNRILEGMKTKDAEKISQNQIDESTSLDYDVNEDDNGIIKRIVINNYRDKERLNEIFNTSTWVFTRMIEKSNRA